MYVTPPHSLKCAVFVCVWPCMCVVALPAVTGLQLFDVTHSSMKARWDSVDGVSGYMLLYAPLSDEGDLDEKEVHKERETTQMRAHKLFSEALNSSL